MTGIQSYENPNIAAVVEDQVAVEMGTGGRRDLVVEDQEDSDLGIGGQRV